MDWVSNERRKDDQDIKYAIIAEGAKIVCNAAFGHTIMNKSKHKKKPFYVTKISLTCTKICQDITTVMNSLTVI